MSDPSRRNLLTLAAMGAAGAATGVGSPAAASSDPNAMAARISAKLFAQDGLARPAPDRPTASDLANGAGTY